VTFDAVLMVDWSGANDRGATPKRDAIWVCLAEDGIAADPIYHRNRQMAETWIFDTLMREVSAGRRILVGFDLCFAYPSGFAKALTGSADPLALWDWFSARVTDTPHANNRFDLAGDINARFPGVGPFWFNALTRDIPHLPRKGRACAGHGLPDKRAADRAAKGAFSPWQMAGAGAVGGQVIMGMPMLSRLRHHFGAALSVWPFEAPDAPIVLAETYFSLMPRALAAFTDLHPIKDAAQVALFAAVFSRMAAPDLAQTLDAVASDEGWVLGLGHEPLLESVAAGLLARC
jgi:molybdopterin molybdotransferase